jgi:hypothetical protein
MNRLSAVLLLALLSWASCAPDISREVPPDAAEQTLWAKYRAADWKNYGCEIITDAELEKLFSFTAKEAVLNSRSLPDQAFCLRTWNKKDWKERESNNEKEGAQWLNPQNRLVLQVFDYNSVEHAKQQIDNLRRDRRDTYAEDVADLGNEALWSTSTVTLLVRKDKYVLNIAIEISDNPHDNLEHAKKVAAIALKKM